jgi:uncharacterized repeat protein (TIGR02543 family)
MSKLLLIIGILTFFLVSCTKAESIIYNASFETYGGNEIDSITVQQGKNIIEPNLPMKIGYTFKGWYSESALINLFDFKTSINFDLKLHAKWSINTYTIVFDSSDIEPITAEYKTFIEAPDDPSKEGHEFGGWYIDEKLSEVFNFDTMPSMNIKLYPKWNINQYVVTYHTNSDELVQEEILNFNGTLTYTLEREGYTFEGWYLEEKLENISSIETMPAYDLDLYAKWSINTYTIVFDSSDIEPITAEYKTFIEAPDDPIKENHEFGGWYIDEKLSEVFNFDTMPSMNIKLYPKWNINQYVVTYHTNSDELVQEEILNFNGTLTYTLEREGYTFEGWYLEEKLENISSIETMPAYDLDLYAKWSINTYTIVFDSSDIEPITAEYKTFIEAPDDPIKENHEFGGWYIDEKLSEVFNFDTMPSMNIKLYPKWNINQNVVTYHTNGGTYLGTKVVNYSSNFEHLVTVRPGNYSFIGWFLDSNLTNIVPEEYLVKSNLDVYAKFVNFVDSNRIYELDGLIKIFSASIFTSYNSSTQTDSSPTKYSKWILINEENEGYYSFTCYRGDSAFISVMNAYQDGYYCSITVKDENGNEPEKNEFESYILLKNIAYEFNIIVGGMFGYIPRGTSRSVSIPTLRVEILRTS